MKYTEFEQQVHELGDLLEVQYTPAAVTVSIKHTQYLVVRTTAPFYVNPEPELKDLDCGHNLYLLASELASTPINERTNQRWNVIVGQGSYHEKCCYRKFRDKFIMQWVHEKVLPHDSLLEFSDEDFKRLIKMLRSMPNGSSLAKIAELGKVPAGDVIE